MLNISLSVFWPFEIFLLRFLKTDILNEEAIIGLARNMGLKKFPGIHKDDPI